MFTFIIVITLSFSPTIGSGHAHMHATYGTTGATPPAFNPTCGWSLGHGLVGGPHPPTTASRLPGLAGTGSVGGVAERSGSHRGVD